MIVNDYDGVCDGNNITYNKLVIRTDKNWNVSFFFDKNSMDKTRFKLYLVNLQYTVNAVDFPNVTSTDEGDKEALVTFSKFETIIGNSYKCAPSTLELSEFVKLELSHYQAQAFNKNTEFGPGKLDRLLTITNANFTN